MTTIASLITSLAVVYSAVYSDADQRKHQSSASLAFVWGIHRDRWIPRTKGQLRGKCFHLMTSSWKMSPKRRQFCAGGRFTNGFSIAIQIRLKFCITLMSILIRWSLQNSVHGTTAVLSWHVQNFVAIWWPATELQQDEVFIEFELRAINR